jgi:hypothetical protein
MSIVYTSCLLAVWRGPKAYIFAGQEINTRKVVWSGENFNSYSLSIKDAVSKNRTDWAFYSTLSELCQWGDKYRDAHNNPRPPDWVADGVFVEWNNETKDYDFLVFQI